MPVGFGWTLADLHANLAGYATLSGASVSDAARYDPWGETRASVSSGLARPFAYQGRLALSATPGAEAYDFVFRAYHPDTATFGSPDDLAGSALDPTSFNRYLYAHANPATLIDPDGHAAAPGQLCAYGPEDCAGLKWVPPTLKNAATRKTVTTTPSEPPRTTPVAPGGGGDDWRIDWADWTAGWNLPVAPAPAGGMSCISAKGCGGAANNGQGSSVAQAFLAGALSSAVVTAGLVGVCTLASAGVCLVVGVGVAAVGVVGAADTIDRKIIHGEEMTAEEWAFLAGGVAGGLGTYRGLAGWRPPLGSPQHVDPLLRPGPYAVESVPVKGPGITAFERAQNNIHGDKFGCHSCGTRSPGTTSGNWVLDHQPPSSLVAPGTPQRGYPQCMACSDRQGGIISSVLRARPVAPPLQRSIWDTMLDILWNR